MTNRCVNSHKDCPTSNFPKKNFSIICKQHLMNISNYLKMLNLWQAYYFNPAFLHFVYYEPLWGKQYTELQYTELRFLEMQQRLSCCWKGYYFSPALSILINHRDGRRGILKDLTTSNWILLHSIYNPNFINTWFF